jgi:hypothetical protein
MNQYFRGYGKQKTKSMGAQIIAVLAIAAFAFLGVAYAAVANPTVDSFDVTPHITFGSVTVNFQVSDTSTTHIDHVELWRATENATCTAANEPTCGWAKIGSDIPAPVGVDTWTSSTTDSPALDHVYLYGLHVVNGAGSFGTESAPVEITASIPSTDTSITSFNLMTPAATGIVDNTAHTVALTVPFGTDVTALSPAIVLAAGATVAPLSGTSQNFTSPVHYITTAQDGTTTADYAITVTVAPPVTHTITATAGAHGAISPTGAVSVNNGANQTFMITPDTGFRVAGVVVDGLPAGTISSKTFSNVTADHSISASFTTVVSNDPSMSSFEFSVQSAAGSISNTTHTVSVTVPFGTNLAALTPTIRLVTGATVAPLSGTAQDFTHPVHYVVTAQDGTTTADFIVTVTAAPAVTHTITATAGVHGSISPTGAVPVNDGTSQTFNINPDNGYRVADVIVDGSSVGVVTSQVFNNVTADHSISASFAQNATGGGGGYGGCCPVVPEDRTQVSTTPTPSSPVVKVKSGSVLGQVTFSNGTLLKSSDKPTIYMYLDGQLRPFSTLAVFKAKGLKFADIQTISADQLAALAVGPAIGYPDGTLIKGNGKTIYIVSGSGKLSIPSMIVFKKMKFSLKNVVHLSDADLAAYEDVGMIK